MKKIKEYFNKHQKFKKIASIFGIAAIILSFTFNILIIATAIAERNKEQEIIEPVVYGDYKPVHNAYKTGDYIYYNVADFGNTYYMYGFIREICVKANRLTSFENGLNDLSSNANGRIYLSYNATGQNRMCVTDQENGLTTYYFETISFEITDTTPSGRKSLRIWVGNTNSPGTALFVVYFNSTTVNFYNHTFAPYEYISLYYDDYANTIDMYNSRVWFNTTYLPMDLNDILDSYHYYYDTSVTQNYNNGYAEGLEAGYTNGYTNGEIAGRQAGYQDGLTVGYANGYTDGEASTEAFHNGYVDGYNDGETAGYNQGYSEGSTGLSSNPFKLIANAFDAVASILNIQVLPNLSLGVLIFTPLIVIMIIVVVKFIRG